MLRPSRFSLAAIALVAACARPGASPRDTSRAASAATAAKTTTAAGSVAASAAADTINQRADRGRIMGDSTATLWVIMASDFQCPFCKQWHDTRFAPLMKNYVAKGRVRLGYVNFPLSQHQNAMPAAEAGMCVSAQNKFLAMHESLFATQAKWETLSNPMPVFDSLAAAAGVNMPAYRECVSKHLTQPLIEADHDRWARAGVGSTPTFFVGGKMVPGGADADVGAAIDAALGTSASKKSN
jgi:protein-disulfide isomerase